MIRERSWEVELNRGARACPINTFREVSRASRPSMPVRVAKSVWKQAMRGGPYVDSGVGTQSERANSMRSMAWKVGSDHGISRSAPHLCVLSLTGVSNSGLFGRISSEF